MADLWGRDVILLFKGNKMTTLSLLPLRWVSLELWSTYKILHVIISWYLPDRSPHLRLLPGSLHAESTEALSYLNFLIGVNSWTFSAMPLYGPHWDHWVCTLYVSKPA